MHRDQARRDYDTYFGVERVETMSHADYWTQALAKVDVVHHHFRLTDEVRSRLLAADALLLSLVAEQ